jgi:hypothetical protein
MREFFPTFFRLIASALLMTFLSSGVAMATYACPELLMPAMPDLVKELPCAEMDKANPVHCALFQSGDAVALDRVAAEPAVTPPTTVSITLMVI